MAAQLADPNLPPDQRPALEEEQAALADAQRPGAGASVAIWSGLTSTQLRQLQADLERTLGCRVAIYLIENWPLEDRRRLEDETVRL